jgi:hypothetical protein
VTVGGLRVFVALPAVLMSRSRMFLGTVVVADIMMMRCLEVMMRRCLMVNSRLKVVLTSWMFC